MGDSVFSVTAIIMAIFIIGFVVGVIVLIVIALSRHRKAKAIQTDRPSDRSSLGEVLKTHRIRCKMTQEFVAETIGVSRQAVSKWEKGTSDPSTSNLIALVKVFGISTEELLRAIE